jgi:hypothetical protein
VTMAVSAIEHLGRHAKVADTLRVQMDRDCH